ncbi:MAG: hypothetical protein DF168_00136 [Candidatus Moanabacter tarae]|uniref:Uncharacterized protein n=1 Tax=Candidatus Moanibacter tarae TaxID=2200854 RepID=A0A2Z4AFX8_9BACT|nr:MAG: hypothetical protein DF168_00136 [Candidatus Moanabacter tarae]
MLCVLLGIGEIRLYFVLFVILLIVPRGGLFSFEFSKSAQLFPKDSGIIKAVKLKPV